MVVCWMFVKHISLLLALKSRVEYCHSQSEINWATTNKMSVRPTKTQISLGIRPVWPESSLSAWRQLGSLATHWAHSEDSDQTGRMPRLIWVFAGRTLILLVLSCRGSTVDDLEPCTIYPTPCRNIPPLAIMFASVLVGLFWFNVAFNNFSVISRRYLVAATGSSMLSFIVLSHWSIIPNTLDMMPHLVTLSWHWVDTSPSSTP